MAKMDVAPLLIANVIADPGEGLDNFPSREDGKACHAFTVTTVSMTPRRRRTGTPSSASAER